MYRNNATTQQQQQHICTAHSWFNCTLQILPSSLTHSPHVTHQSLFDQRNGFLLLVLAASAHVVQNEALHAKRLSMVGKLLQDGVCRLDALLVLLGLVLPDYLAEQVLVFPGQGAALSCLGVLLDARHCCSSDAAMKGW